MQHYWVIPLYGYIRFAMWDEILVAPEPDEDLIYPRAVWHFARGMAYARTDQLDLADAEAEALEVLTGEIAAARGDYETAMDALTSAVELEDALTYDEPPPWHQPVRQSLGAVYLDAGRPAEAERVYREDLETFPENGWSLWGLQQSLEAQGKNAEAAEVAEKFATAWQCADVELTASRL